MIKAVIFDCFGVLYPDTYWTMAHRHLGADLSGKEQALHDLLRAVDLGDITRDDLWREFGLLVNMSKEQVYAELESFGGLDSQLLQFIEDKKRDYKIGMISNVGQGFIERMFVSNPASYYFDDIVLSSEVGLVKPDIRIYEMSARNLGVEVGQCLFIDDLEKNVQGAKDAGMQAMQYKNFPQFVEDFNKLIL
jgi:putative hydrolase of the HAD superfamily